MERTTQNEAVSGYAQGGYIPEVNALLAQGANRHYALYGYLLGRHAQAINALIAQDGHGYAVRDCLSSHHLEPKNISLFVLSFIDNNTIRKIILQTAKTKYGFDEEWLQNKSEKVTKIIKSYQLGFFEAQSLLIPGVRTWLLQGTQLVRENKIIADIFWNITEKLLNLPFNNAKIVFDTIHKQFFKEIKKDLTTGFYAFFRKKEATEQLVDEAKQRAEKRALC